MFLNTTTTLFCLLKISPTSYLFIQRLYCCIVYSSQLVNRLYCWKLYLSHIRVHVINEDLNKGRDLHFKIIPCGITIVWLFKFNSLLLKFFNFYSFKYILCYIWMCICNGAKIVQENENKNPRLKKRRY